MMVSSFVVAAALGFLGDGALLNDTPREARSARLLAQADVPAAAPAGSISELDNRIQLLRNGRRGIGGSIVGIVVGASLIVPGVLFIILGAGAELLGVGLGTALFIVGGVFLAGAVLLIVLCSIGIASSGSHNRKIDDEVKVMQDQRDKLVGRPVSMDWAPSPAFTLARF